MSRTKQQASLLFQHAMQCMVKITKKILVIYVILSLCFLLVVTFRSKKFFLGGKL